MAFWGKSFSFNGIPCETFDLMIYEIDGATDDEVSFGGVVRPVEETVGKRWRPYHYGVQFEDKQEISVVFGVNERRIDGEKYLDRYELDEISSWLTGHDEYLWLEIEQNDMSYVRYRVITTELEQISYGVVPWALKAVFSCDGPYAYMYPQVYTYDLNGTETVTIDNESSLNSYYWPKMRIEDLSGDLSIVNLSDDNREFEFTDVPASASVIEVDNDHQVITNNQGLNLYENFNYNFLRLKRGINELTITGNCTLMITCEFPVSIGG